MKKHETTRGQIDPYNTPAADDSASLAEILSPLIDLFNDKYRVPGGEDYEFEPWGLMGPSLEQSPNQEVIEIPQEVENSQSAVSAILTLLWRTGSNKLWNQSRFQENDPERSPLRFSLVKTLYWMETHWQWNRYLVVDYLGELDRAAATDQIARLVAALNGSYMLLSISFAQLMQF